MSEEIIETLETLPRLSNDQLYVITNPLGEEFSDLDHVLDTLGVALHARRIIPVGAKPGSHFSPEYYTGCLMLLPLGSRTSLVYHGTGPATQYDGINSLAKALYGTPNAISHMICEPVSNHGYALSRLCFDQPHGQFDEWMASTLDVVLQFHHCWQT